MGAANQQISSPTLLTSVGQELGCPAGLFQGTNGCNGSVEQMRF